MAARTRGRAAMHQVVAVLDGVADVAEDLADAAAQEDQGDDRHDGDEGEDQRVLRETLAVLVATEGCDESGEIRHGFKDLLSTRSPPLRHAGGGCRETESTRTHELPGAQWPRHTRERPAGCQACARTKRCALTPLECRTRSRRRRTSDKRRPPG